MQRRSYNEGQAASNIIYGSNSSNSSMPSSAASSARPPVSSTPYGTASDTQAGSGAPTARNEERLARFDVIRADIFERCHLAKVRPEELFDKLDMDNRGSLTYVQLQEGLEHVLKLRCRGNTFHDITYALDPERRYQVSRADFQREFAPSVASMYSSSSSSAPSGNSHLHVPASPAYGSTSNSSAVGSDELEPLSTTDRNALYSKIVRRFADVPLAEVRRQMMAFEDSHNPGSISCPNLKRALTKYADDFPLMDVVTELYGRAVQAVLVDDVLNLIEEALRHRKREGKHIVAGASPMKSPTAFSGTSSGTASVPRSPAASFGGNVSTVARQVLEQVGFIKQQCRKADRGGEGVIARHVFRMNVRKAGVTADDADIDELSVALADGAGNIAYDKMEAQLQRLA